MYHLSKQYVPPAPFDVGDFYGDEQDEYGEDELDGVLLPNLPYVQIDPLKCSLSPVQHTRFVARVVPLQKGEEIDTYLDRYLDALLIAVEIITDEYV